MKQSFAVAVCLAFIGAISMNALVNAQQQTGVGQNQNVVTGSDNQFIGDMFRQRQNEGVIGTSSVNPLHQMVAYNDYRTVDMSDDSHSVVPPSPIGVLHKLWNLLRKPWLLARSENESEREREREGGEEGEMGDSAQAWIGLSFTDNGKDWYTGLHPGHPFDTSNLAPVLKNGSAVVYEAASDPVMATTADKFLLGGIAFTPGANGKSVGFVSRFVDRNDTETGRNIHYEWTKELVVAPTGFFVDKPNIAAGPDGHVYVAFVVFDQNDPQRLSSKIYFYYSSNYGETWNTTPVILSDPLTRNQSPWILVDPNNENTVYVGWRVFANRSGGIANAIVGRKSTNGGASFIPSTPYTVASQLKAFDQPQGTLPQSLPIPRSNAYPTATIDGNGAIHAAIQEYVNPKDGTPLGPGTPITNGVPRITVMSSYNGGVNWTARRAVDFAAGSGTQFMPVLLAVGEPGASCPGSSGPRSRVMLSYYDARAGNVGTKTGTNGFVAGGDKQFDVRITTAPACPRDSANRLVFSPSVQMSRYALSADKPHGIQKTAGFDFTAVNRGYSMFCGGNCAFTGDYIHLAARVPYVLTPAGWRPTTSSAVDKAKLPAPVVQGVWADARDVKLPTTPAAPVPVTDPTFIDSLPWWNYQAPGSGQLPSACFNAGSRDQNIYTAEFASGELFAAAPETFRTSNIPRAYPLYVENRAGTQRLFRLTIDPAARASFEFKSFNTEPPNFNVGGRNNKISDIVIGAYSSVTGSVIVGAGVSAPVLITVEQIDGNGRAISGGATTAVTLFTAGAAPESNTETHPPLVSQTPTITKPFAGKTPIRFEQNPFTQTPFTQTPFTQTPFTQTTFTQNPFSQTPFTQTPFTQTTTIFDVTDISFLVSNGGANTAAFSTMLTIANAQLLEGLRTSNSYLFQVFINRLSPVALLNGCRSADGFENIQISNIRAPFTQTPFSQTPFSQTPFTQTPFSQTPFTQTPFTQTPFTQTNNPSDPTVSNSTFYVAPPSPGEQTARLQSVDGPRVVNARLTFAELDAALRGVNTATVQATDDYRNERPTDLIMYTVRAFQIKDSSDATFVSLFGSDGTPQLGLTVTSDAPDVVQVGGTAVFDPAGPQTSSGGAAVPVKLAFVTQPPASAAAGSPFSVQVAVQDGFGNLIANSAVPVTIGISSNPSSGTLSGTLTRNAVNGIATFDDLSINNAGQGYTLVASSGLLAPATSAPFTVAQTVLNADLEVSQSFAQPIINTNTPITLTVANAGPAQATGVVLTDTLPVAADFISVSSESCAYNPDQRTVTCAVGTLAPGTSRDYTIVIRSTAITTLTNTASVAGAQPDPNPDDNPTSETAFVASYAPCASPTFSGPFVRALNTESTGIVTPADFNEDGFADLFFAKSDGNFILLLSDGQGGYVEPQYFEDTGPQAATSADLNSDGHADLAAVSTNPAGVSGGPAEFGTALGDGTGNFVPGMEDIFLPLAATFAIDNGDFNHDGHPDVAVSSAHVNDNTIVVLLGVGDGSFNAPLSVPAGPTPGNLVLADFNVDGHLDIAVNNIGFPTISVMHGDGEGGFSAPQTINLAVNSGRLRRMNDVNSDGAPDLGVTTSPGSGVLNNLLLLLNDGAGNFPTATEIIGPRGVGFATTSDLNGDGRLDVAALIGPEHRVVILEGNGTGQFTETASYLTGTTQNHFAIEDLNADGRPDIVGTVRGGYYLLFNTCAGDQGARADLSSTVIGPETGTVGNQLTYSAFVANNGPDPATNVLATFLVPSGMTFVSSTHDCTVLYGTVQCPLSTIAPDGNASFTVTVQAFAAGTRVNRLMATASEPDPDSSNNVGDAPTTVAAGSFTFVVTNTADAGPGTLRQAILDSNLNVGSTNQIHFNIPGEAPFVITPQSVLPNINVPVVIDGTTQPGYVATPLIEVTGINAPGSNGLTINAGNTMVRGLSLTRWFPNAISVSTNGNNVFEGNYIGLTPAGVVSGNGTGLNLLAPNNRVGGTTPGARNVISGNNSNGINIGGQVTNGVLVNTGAGSIVLGNYIGTNPAGTAPAASISGASGVRVSVPNVTIGSPLGPNVISGNGGSGNGRGVDANAVVQATGSTVVLAAATNLVVQSNFIGTDATGTAAIPNVVGVQLNAGSGRIGGANSGEGNLISGNTNNGVNLAFQSTGGTSPVLVTTPSNYFVEGNIIGLNASGTAALPNLNTGVLVLASNNTIGGMVAGAGNVISGNSAAGIILSSNTSVTPAVVATANTVVGNRIGTNPAGTAAIANRASGINLTNNAASNVIGGTAPGAGNLISGNGANGAFGAGVNISNAHDNTVQGNLIGTNANGTAALPNANGGIEINNANNNLVGGTVVAARNLISGNGSNTGQAGNVADGVGIFGTSANNQVQGNFIGTDVTGTSALANTSDGVFINATGAGNVIGSALSGTPVAAAANTIAFNAVNGVALSGSASGVAIRGNSIFSNGSLGIDLGQNGVTPNDGLDVDIGPNGVQNFPVVGDVLPDGTVSGTLHSTPSTTFELDFYANVACETNGFGEGRRYLGSGSAATDANGNATFEFSVAPPAGSEVITATATAAGGTSEFSACRTPSANGQFVVTNTDDAGAGSLRQAIIDANAGSSLSTITFNIPNGPATIAPVTPLPVIMAPVVIDGYTQPGSSPNTLAAGTNAVINVELRGPGTEGFFVGLNVAAGAATIRGLAIGGFTTGIQITENSTGSSIEGNFIGTNAQGTVVIPNGDGIRVGSPNNRIGGATSAARNLISGSVNNGIRVSDVVLNNEVFSRATGTVIVNNLIGTTRDGLGALPNREGIAVSVADVTIGGVSVLERNIIAGNTSYGINSFANLFNGAVTSAPSSLIVQGNYIGVGVNGAAVANGNTGINVNGRTTIGGVVGTTPGACTGACNVIAGNGQNGIGLYAHYDNPSQPNGTMGTVYSSAAGSSVMGNFIGVNAAGAAVPNGPALPAFSAGISASVEDVVIGGPAPGARNVISGNNSTGINLGIGVLQVNGNRITSAAGTVIRSNYIGVSPDGMSAMGNGTNGIGLSSANVTIGGPNAADRNIISGNGQSGVSAFAGLYDPDGQGPAQNVPTNPPTQPVALMVINNYVGTNVLGSAAIPNRSFGLNLSAPAALVKNNLVSGNIGSGVVFGAHFDNNTGQVYSSGSNAVAEGNFIGVDATGNAPLANTLDGVSISSPAVRVGGATSLLRNVIAANGGNGVGIHSNTTATQQIVTSGISSVVQGNYIGINAAGTTAMANGQSAIGSTAANVTIGGGPDEGNLLVSGTNGSGVSLSRHLSPQGAVINAGGDSTVRGNIIGLNANQSQRMNGGTGISVNSAGNTITQNVIAGNGVAPSFVAGISLGPGGNTNTIRGNLIGTNPSGDAGLGNAGAGIFVGAAGNTIGGAQPADRNVIVGNGREGVSLNSTDGQTTTGNRILGNYIGVKADGATALPNGQNGVMLFAQINGSVFGNTIGGSSPGEGNVISGNTGGGVSLGGTGTTNNTIIGNLIGTIDGGLGALPNASNGIFINDAVDNSIGGTGPTDGNLIAFNTHNGIAIQQAAVRNRILGNRIHSNTQLGIDLNWNGPTANDQGDGDTGANNLQNFPVLSNASNSHGATTRVDVNLTSFANGQYTLQFFASSSCDPSGNGEGDRLIGHFTGQSAPATSQLFMSEAVPVGQFITATATDNQGNTSEFSQCQVVTEGGTADRLAFVVQPSSTAVGASIAPPVQVAIQDATGNTVTTATGAVTIGIGANPAGGGLFGTVTRDAVNGIAAFNDLSIDRAGSGYTLVANSGSLVGATSQPFDIQPSVFTVTTTADNGPGSLRQAILDANGRIGVSSTLRFNFSGEGPHTIAPQSPLPSINASMIIDATAGGVCTGTAPTVVIDGASAGSHGLNVTSPGVTIRGLAIGGFALSGIFLNGSGNTLVECNYLGVAPNGTSAMANQDGLRIVGSSSNTIGGATASARNVIAGNSQYGVNVANGIANRIEGNFIGTNAGGNAALGNGRGIFVATNSNQIIGNLISGNAASGVEITGGATGTTVAGNRVGTDATGASAIPNQHGVSIGNATGNTIGGTQPADRNIIAGNAQHGVVIDPPDAQNATNNRVIGNYIGVSADGVTALPNGAYGVRLFANVNSNITGNTIGGSSAGEGNLISGNGLSGVALQGSGTTGNTTLGNLIGTIAGGAGELPNATHGVFITDASDNTIGGTGLTDGNLIAFNTRNGIITDGVSVRNRILGNRIHSNTMLGIDLNGNGVSANDDGDGDVGGNNLQNFPVLSNASNAHGATTRVDVNLTSFANGLYTIQFFANAGCDPSGNGEGQRLIGHFTDHAAPATTPLFMTEAVPAGQFITALATDADGNTSEFSPCAEVDPFIALTPNPFAIVTNTSAPMTVTLSHPAGVGGQTVNLASNNPVAAVQPSILIAEGASAGTATITTGSGAGSAIITATAAGFQDGTATVNVSLRTMTLSAPSSLVGVGRSLTGTITLGQPAPTGGLAVNLVSGSPSFVTVSPSSVTIAQGATTGTFTINGIASGSSTITASATGASNATLNMTTTNSSLISMGNPPVVAPGQTSGVAVSLGIDAPPGGVTISFESSDTNIATVTPSVFIPAGVRIPAANPQITGVTPGTTSITASAAGFAPDTKAVVVTLTLSFTPATNFAVIAGRTSNITLGLSSPAPAGGLTLNTSIDNTTFATVPSTAFVAAGSTSVGVPVTGVAVGTTTIRASGTGIAQVSASVRVDPTPPITIANATIGKDLQVQLNGTVGLAAPAGGVVVTITSPDPSKVLLATADNVAGSASITRTVNAGSTSIPAFWVHALDATGTVNIQATASGYADDTSTITLRPSGFALRTTDFTTNSFAANRTLQVDPAILDASTLNYVTSQELRGGLNVAVALTSSNTTVGTIAGTATFTGGQSFSLTAAFDPAAAGQTTISLTTPAGFSTPNSHQSLIATVTAPNITIGNFTVGRDLQVSASISLAAAPPSPVTVTVTSNNGTIATITENGTLVGDTSVTFTNVTTTSVGPVFIQGRSLGTTTVTVQAPGYNNGTSNVTVDPSGFVLRTTDFTTNSFAANRTLQIDAAVLHPTSLNYVTSQEVRGGLNVTVPVTSSDTNVGTIVGSTTFVGGGSSFNLGTAFDPAAAGQTTISLATPASFSTPNNLQSLIATVTAPNITIGNFTVGRDLQVSASISLAAAPPSPVTVTVTSNNGTIATITENGTLVGDTSVTFTNVTTTSVGPVFIQGRSLGTTTVTVQAPGYNNGTSNVTVDPSGFVIRTTDFTTNTFAANRTLQIDAAVLHPTSLNYVTSQELRGGLTAAVPVTSSDTNVGTIVGSPATFVGGGSSFNLGTAFDPATAGDATIRLGTPAGFQTPNNLQSILAHVDAPNITIGNFTVGRDLQVSASISLAVAPPSPVTVTVTSNNGTIATITENGTLVGDTSVTFTNVTTTSVGPVFIQGRSLGTTTVTVQAAGYNDGTSNVTVDPSGFVLRTTDFTINASAPNRSLQIDAAVLHPTSLNYVTSQELRGGLTAAVPVTSSDTNVGTIVGSPATFVGGGSSFNLGTAFDPAAAGSSIIRIGTPAGFSIPSNLQATTATVNP